MMKKLTEDLKKDWYILLLVAAGFALGAYFYPRLPDIVPIHWDSSGNVNGYGSRFTGAFLLPIINLAVYLLLVLVPHIDPRAKNYEKFQGSYQIIKSLVIAILLITQVCTNLIALGIRIDINLIIGIAVSLMLIVIGDVMGRFRHNYFVGVKTPWTLANEDVWRKTHRLAGPLWVIGGIANLVLTVLNREIEAAGLIIIVAAISIIPLVYSYIAFRKAGGGN
jgi:uncharacterized membrane protein